VPRNQQEGKGAGVMLLYYSVCEVLISAVIDAVVGYTTESVTRSLSEATVTFQPQSTATASWPVPISNSAESRRLSWPDWLVTY